MSCAECPTFGVPTKQTGVMDVAQLQECQELDKFLNFVEDDLDYFEYEQGINPNIVVVGRLKMHAQFWRSIGASQFILDVIEQGYRIPFHSSPPVSFSRNNKSALAHPDFVEEAISELLVSHRIFELDSLPHNVNPLSVSVQSSGKKHSILDLRLINKHLWKQSVKFEDLKVVLNYLDRGHFLFSFDIMSGYHHIEIFPPHQSFLGFSWFYKGRVRCFCFKVLPFGLSTAPYIFTKLFRSLVSYWRQQGIHIVVFLDDGLEEAPSYQVALSIVILLNRTWFLLGLFPILKNPFGYPLRSLIGWVSLSIFFRDCSLFLG